MKAGRREQKQIQYENAGRKWTSLLSLYRNSKYFSLHTDSILISFLSSHTTCGHPCKLDG